MQNQKSRNLWLDLFRYFLAFLIICIHFQYLPDNLFPICRIAVPTFFIFSGFFLYSENTEIQLKKNKNLIINSLKYLFVGLLIYITYDFIFCLVYNQPLNDFFTHLFYNDFIKNFVLLSDAKAICSGFHLWYLIAFFVSAVLHYVCVKFNLTKHYIYSAPLLLIISKFFLDFTKVDLIYTRNALFFAFPCICIGFLIGKFKNKNFSKFEKINFAFLGVAFMFLQISESLYKTSEFYISSILSAIFFTLFFTSVNFKANKFSDWYYKYIGKNAPFYIFILHVFIGQTLEKYISINKYIFLLVIFLCSFILYEIVHLTILTFNIIKEKISLSKHNKKSVI